MLIGIKDASRLIGISIIACCAVLICTMFFNFYIDVQSVQQQITDPQAMIFYTAQVSTARLVCLITGGCLLLTSVIMLLFYIKHYIDTHKRELGLCKALGYSNIAIAKHFWVFGISTFLGAAAGFGGAFLLMPPFYALQMEGSILPEIAIHFHPSVLCYFVLLPTALFSALSIGYACWQLQTPVLHLLKDQPIASQKVPKCAKRKKDNATVKQQSSTSFLQDLRRATLRSKKALVFFVIFASFCFSAMTQMSFSMQDLSSEMMGAMILIIGLVLAFSTLFLAISTIIRGSAQTLALMQAFGYSHRQCSRAILCGYRPLSYVGFALGTVYQYALLRLMVDLVFVDVENMPVYQFDFDAMLLSLAVFVLVYEMLMLVCAAKIKKISLKEIMLGSYS